MSARRPLLIFPCNGNGLEALDCLGDEFECLGFIDDTPGKQHAGAYGLSVFPRSALVEMRDAAVLAVPGGPASYQARRQIIAGLGVAPERFATVIHPGAHVSKLARLGRNVLVMAGAVITSNAEIGDHVCVLPNTVIHHDVTVGSFSLIGANVAIAGSVRIGDNCYVGSGSNVKNGLTIGARALIGLGSNVTRDVPEGAVVAGNPARPVSKQG
ncbi:MAG: NeuD/PglB/VioB family sugar acetyltransferase [Pseudomonadota bacterium]